MSAQSPIQKLLAKPMTRKEFLQHVGLALLAMIGVTKVINNLLKEDHTSHKATGSKWGGGKFGV